MIPWQNVIAVLVVMLIAGGLYYSWISRPRNKGLAIAEEQLRLFAAQVKLLEDNLKAVERQNDVLERIAAALEAKGRSTAL